MLAPDDLTRIIGVLDWEMSTVGDPLMDLGTALSYWVHADDPPSLQAVRMCATTLPGSLPAASCSRDIRSAPGAIFRISCFTIVSRCSSRAASCSRSTIRFKQGLTHDERFGAMIHAVHALSATAVRAIESGRI